MDIVEPQLAKFITESAEPSRAVDLRLMLEPKCANESTDKAVPNLPSPATLMPLARRAKPRRLIEEPNELNSITESVDPRRAPLLIDSELPICRYDSTLTLSEIRAKLRMERLEPNETESNTDIAVDMRTFAVAIETLEPNLHIARTDMLDPH
jgi:hypothetical protein